MKSYRASPVVPWALAFIVAGALATAPFASFAVQFTPVELAALRKGEIVVQELPSSRKGGFYGGSSFVLVNAPLDAVWRTLDDVGGYAKVLPHTLESTELSRKGQRSLLRMKIGNAFASALYHVEIGRDVTQKTISFAMVPRMPHDLDDLHGYWRLFPQGPNRTLVAYVVAVRAPPGLVALVGPEMGVRAVRAILGVPAHLKKWVERAAVSR